MIQVKVNHTLVGRTGKGKKELDDRTNSERLDGVLKFVKDQFGDRPFHILDGNLLLNDSRRYPNFFAAGWFFSEDKATELVVIGHGNSLENARGYLMNSMKNVDWKNLAKHV